MLIGPSSCTSDPDPFSLSSVTSMAENIFPEFSLAMIQSLHDGRLPAQRPEQLGMEEQPELTGLRNKEIPVCWEHGCNGKVFSSWSNLRRHQRERALQAPKCYCPRCGAHFSRTTARNQHLANMSCRRIRRYSNGRMRPSLRKIQETYGLPL